MEAVLQQASLVVALCLEGASVLVIAIGAVEALVKLFGPLLKNAATHGKRRDAWLSLARWLLIGLEFMLAADVVRTAIAPSWEDIGMLAAVAAIRTFLNYFLERDLEQAMRKRELSTPTVAPVQ